MSAATELRTILARLPEPEGAARAIQDVRDWEALLVEAEGHGVDGVLVAGVESLALTPRAHGWENAKTQVHKRALWAEVQSEVLHEVLRALAADGIRVAVLKGPVLAARLYRDAAVRPSNDLDLLLDAVSLDRAAVALRPLGYVLEGGALGRFFRRHHHHVHALHRTLPTLELHFDAYRGFGTSLPADPLLHRAERCGLPSWNDAHVLQVEDEFLYLAVHAASHRLERLLWLFDLKLFLRQHPGLRWDVVAVRARANHLSAVVSFVCAVLADWLDAPLDAAWAHLPALARARRRAAEGLVGRRPSHAVNASADLLFCTLLCQDFARAAFLSTRFLGIKMFHEAPMRVRSRFSGCE
ncbi:MAG TPA: nucleotidyltransferase family protein [Polyangiaceae bacterium]|jgi:hypothetical protein